MVTAINAICELPVLTQRDV